MTRSSNGRPHAWVTAIGPTGQLMNVRVEKEGGRWIMTAILIEDGRITSDLLRQIQPARIEAAISAGAARTGLTPVDDPDDPITLGDLRQAPVRHLLDGAPAPSISPRPALSRPDGTDAWYVDFAERYRAAVATTRAPATLLAAEADVPPSAVHRWAAEARRRGHLPPGRKGSAG